MNLEWQAATSDLPDSKADQSNRQADYKEKLISNTEDVLHILHKLQALPWCRMDCSFQGTRFPYFAHNLIQVTREWINWEGENVVQKVAEHFAALEDRLSHASDGQL